MDYFDQFIAVIRATCRRTRISCQYGRDGWLRITFILTRQSIPSGLVGMTGSFDLASQGCKTHQSTSIGTFFPTQVGATGLELSFDENGRARFRLMLGSF
jgi:hypothetical protein